jgi:hypothetical protein
MQCFILVLTLLIQHNKAQEWVIRFITGLMVLINLYAILYILSSLVHGLPMQVIEFVMNIRDQITSRVCAKRCHNVRLPANRQRI